jgi:flagella basal body P-ring formation protein FlgA
MSPPKSMLLLLPLLLAQPGVAGNAPAGEPSVCQLLPQAQVDGAGIFLDQLFVPNPPVALPHIRLAPSPMVGQAASFSRTQLIELAQNYCSGLLTTNWSGATQVRVSRRTRQFTDSDITELLSSTLQRQFVKNGGELELHLTRPWTPVPVPDEPLTLKVYDVPATGLMPNFVVRCELWDGGERFAGWQLAVQAAEWREVPVAHSPLARGQLLRDADIVLERRDVLVLHDTLAKLPPADESIELAQNIPTGRPLLNHSIRVRPLIERGRVVEAVYQNGTLSISLKVEALEDGALGQMVRVRNPKTKREIYGKVQNEQTFLLSL